MDFFDRQEASRRATRFLVLLFGGAFLLVALATGLMALIVLVLGLGTNGTTQGIVAGADLGDALLANAATLAGIVAAVAGLMVIASLFRAATLSQGGGRVATMLGGSRIAPDDRDPMHRRLLNVVEEMAIASGLPVPEVYVLEAERGINAFAAGLTPADAAVAVTRGSLEQLDRAELQGVIAHEFSHILNGDMRLNLRLMGFSFGILVLSLIGRWLLRATSRGAYIGRRKGNSVALMLGLGLTVIGFIGVFLSRLIKAAVSRQREVLADASAVQFTREPLALAGALKKIGGFTPFIETVETEEVSHMLFGQAGRSFVGLFATHPPLPKRIAALDPSFEPGDYIKPASPAPSLGGGDQEAPAVSRFAGQAAGIHVDTAGTIEPEAGAVLRQAIPADIADAAHSTQSSWLLVLALGLERNGGTAAEQRLLASQLGPERAERCFALRRQLDALEPGLLLPLFELTVPALKSRPREQIDFLFELLAKLAAADGELTLFEFLLQRMLAACFERVGGRRARAAERADAAEQLLAVLSVYGASEAAAQSAAFTAGLRSLGAGTDAAQETRARGRIENARDDADFKRFDWALSILAAAPGAEKRRVLTALAVTMRHDRRIEIAEAEIFRAIAAVLGCPVPPLHVIS